MMPSTPAPEPCPLCTGADSQFFYQDTQRDYWRCADCDLIFVPAAQLPSVSTEKHHYDQHTNSPRDASYRAFLDRLLLPLGAYLPANARGLDFGSGPGPTASVIMQERGFDVDIYDPFYAPNTPWRERDYQFICCTEVIEHIHWPAPILDTLWQRLNPNGVFGIMTKRATTLAHFKHWHYKNDPTHVRFYSDASFNYLAQRWQAHKLIKGRNIILLIK